MLSELYICLRAKLYCSFQATTCARPLVGVHVDGAVSGVSVCLPAVFRAPIRPDVVNFVHDQMAKNTRQPYAVNKDAGEYNSTVRIWEGASNLWQFFQPLVTPKSPSTRASIAQQTLLSVT